MADYISKYAGEEIEETLDAVANKEDKAILLFNCATSSSQDRLAETFNRVLNNQDKHVRFLYESSGSNFQEVIFVRVTAAGSETPNHCQINYHERLYRDSAWHEYGCNLVIHMDADGRYNCWNDVNESVSMDYVKPAEISIDFASTYIEEYHISKALADKFMKSGHAIITIHHNDSWYDFHCELNSYRGESYTIVHSSRVETNGNIVSLDLRFYHGENPYFTGTLNFFNREQAITVSESNFPSSKAVMDLVSNSAGCQLIIKDKKIFVRGRGLLPTDTVKLMHFVNQRYGDKSVMRPLFKRYKGWVEPRIPLALGTAFNEDRKDIEVFPVGYANFAEYEMDRFRDVEDPAFTKSDVGKLPLSVHKRCGLVVMRDGKQISNILRFTVSYGDTKSVFIGSGATVHVPTSCNVGRW